MREFSLYEFDLEDTRHAVEVLDRARTPSLMASFPGLLRARRQGALRTRQARRRVRRHRRSTSRNPNPDALLIFIADHISIPADLRRMEMTDKERYERIRETLGEHLRHRRIRPRRRRRGHPVAQRNRRRCTSVKIDPDAARELVDSLGGDMMMISNELEKLLLYVGEKKRITLGDVETMVLAAKQRTLYELTDALSATTAPARWRFWTPCSPPETATKPPSAISTCWPAPSARCWSSCERNVRDTRALYQVLWQGFRIPPFAAEDVIRQARRYKSRRELTRALRLIARADVALRSNPPSKRLVLENLILDLAAEPKPTETSPWQQEQLLGTLAGTE